LKRCNSVALGAAGFGAGVVEAVIGGGMLQLPAVFAFLPRKHRRPDRARARERRSGFRGLYWATSEAFVYAGFVGLVIAAARLLDPPPPNEGTHMEQRVKPSPRIAPRFLAPHGWSAGKHARSG
jgi:hypothetical protein